MAGTWCHSNSSLRILPSSALTLPLPTRKRSFLCCSDTSIKEKKDKPTPELLKLAVNGVTEILRFFSKDTRSDELACVQNDGPAPCGIDDVIKNLKSDYENYYFVTGIFNRSSYAEDCIFEDPTIKFRGTELYSQNLKLLVPFFEDASILLKDIGKVQHDESQSVLASWKLRTYLKLPWRPLISIDGTTVYELDHQYKIVRHVESWNVSPLEAIGQIFTPGL